MNKAKRIFYMIFSIIIGMLLFTCFQILPVEKLVKAQSVELDKLNLAISTPKDRYLQGEPVLLNLQVKNISADSVKWKGALSFISPNLSALIRSENGEEIRIEGGMIGVTFIEPLNTIQPNEILNENLVITASKKGGEPLLPGQYQIRLEFTYQLIEEERQKQTIISNPVTVLIEEPQGVDRQAYDYINNMLKPSFRNMKPRQYVLLQQDFVNRFGNTVYGKYIAFDLANTYRAIGDDVSAERELLKISNTDFYYSKQVKSTLREIGAKLRRIPLIELPEDAPVPSQSPTNPQ